MKIGIVGARIAGGYAGWLLSRAGHEVLLLDHTTEGEKPCGGGLTGKSLRRMPWFGEHPFPHTRIRNLRFRVKDGYASILRLRQSVCVVSRQSLESFLRRRAVESGARFLPERALGFQTRGPGWAIETAAGPFLVDYLIGADGANSSVRRALAGAFDARDLSLALGYSLPGTCEPETLVIEFQESGFPGYLWAFPHVDHSSVGIFRGLLGCRASELKSRVDTFLAERYPAAGPDRMFYAARIPTLRRESLLGQRVAGGSWALLGDAAGFVDAITAEGICYALGSAEILAESLRAGNPGRYESAWRSEFGADLESAARWRDCYYGGQVLRRPFLQRALQTIRHSRTAATLLDGLLGGSVSYKSFLRNLVIRSPQIAAEALADRARPRGLN